MPRESAGRAEVQQQRAFAGQTGHEIAGCCFQVATRDHARFGRFVLGWAKAIVPDDWFARATVKLKDIDEPGHGYGLQWWT